MSDPSATPADAERAVNELLATFGDFDPDDTFGVEPADPEQVARRLHELRRREQLERVDFDDLDELSKLVAIAIVAELLAWLRRQGSHP